MPDPTPSTPSPGSHRAARWRSTSVVACLAVAAGAAPAQSTGGVVVVPLASSPGAATASLARATDEDPRWSERFSTFAAADLATPPKAGGIVFVGSSSIRLWTALESEFAELAPVIVNRGFGGSLLADCVRHVDRLVLPYQPRTVVLYAGENDLHEGRSPQQVLQSFTAFVERVRQALPQARIVFVSIKPSPSRWRIQPQVVETNRLIADAVRGRPGLDFVDVHASMVDAQGQPRAELFLGDRLHLNAEGYALWRQAIAAALR
jgi:lysophospholipase L1-like esterase